MGFPIANRHQRGIEGLVGFFVNTLVLRTDLSGNPTFRSAGSRQGPRLEAYAHQDIPFEKLVEELRSDRDLGRTPLFQVMLALLDAPLEKLQMPGMVATPDGRAASPLRDSTSSSIESGAPPG